MFVVSSNIPCCLPPLILLDYQATVVFEHSGYISICYFHTLGYLECVLINWECEWKWNSEWKWCYVSVNEKVNGSDADHHEMQNVYVDIYCMTRTFTPHQLLASSPCWTVLPAFQIITINNKCNKTCNCCLLMLIKHTR